MPSQASGQAPKPSKNTRRPSKPPAIIGGPIAGEHFVEHVGGSIAKSAGHAAHDAVHLGRKVVRAINPFD